MEGFLRDWREKPLQTRNARQKYLRFDRCASDRLLYDLKDRRRLSNKPEHEDSVRILCQSISSVTAMDDAYVQRSHQLTALQGSALWDDRVHSSNKDNQLYLQARPNSTTVGPQHQQAQAVYLFMALRQRPGCVLQRVQHADQRVYR